MQPESDIAPVDTAAQLARMIMWRGSQLTRWGINRTVQMPYSLTSTQLSVLYLVRYGITTPGAVARRLLLTPKAITYAVDRLTELGFVTRTNDPSDRRKVQLAIQEKGQRMHEELEAASLDPLVRRIELLDEEDVAAIKRCVDVLSVVLRDLYAELEQENVK